MTPTHVTATWIGAQTITCIQFIVVAYVFACFIRHGLLTEKFRFTPTVNNFSGPSNSYKMATAIFSFCLPSLAITQIYLIVATTSSDTPNTSDRESSFCSVAFGFKTVFQSLVSLLSFAYMWYCQRLFYRRSSVKHLQTMAYSLISWLTLVPKMLTSVVLQVTTLTLRKFTLNASGCVRIPGGSALRNATFLISLVFSIVGYVMLIGLFLYPLYATKRDKNRPAHEGMSKAVMHRVIRRFTLCVLLSVVGSTVPLVLSGILLGQRPKYLKAACDDLSLLSQIIAVVLSIEERTKILFWHAV